MQKLIKELFIKKVSIVKGDEIDLGYRKTMFKILTDEGKYTSAHGIPSHQKNTGGVYIDWKNYENRRVYVTLGTVTNYGYQWIHDPVTEPEKVFVKEELNRTDSEVLTLYRYTKQGNWNAVDPEIKTESERCLSFKDLNESIFNETLTLLDENLLKKIIICCVPSHKEDNKKHCMYRLTQELSLRDRIDGSDCLQRTKSIQKLTTAGSDRSVEVHYRSIDVFNKALFTNKSVLLLDDVKTSGNSLKACQNLLKNNGAKNVFMLAIWKTV